jgi:hypothetical protein
MVGASIKWWWRLGLFDEEDELSSFSLVYQQRE